MNDVQCINKNYKTEHGNIQSHVCIFREMLVKSMSVSSYVKCTCGPQHKSQVHLLPPNVRCTVQPNSQTTHLKKRIKQRIALRRELQTHGGKSNNGRELQG